MTGSVGSGKSTTLAALVEQVNIEATRATSSRSKEPDRIHFRIERLPHHPSAKCTPIRARSVRRARCAPEDPDVIMVGEMRDLETISLASPRGRDWPFGFGERCIPEMLRGPSTGFSMFSGRSTEQIESCERIVRGILSAACPRADGKAGAGA